jgi:hypothetical protein
MTKHLVQRVIKRIDKSISGPISIFADQFLYGHREILCAYAEFSDETMFTATTEHGWDLKSAPTVRKLPFGSYPHLSWCQQRIDRTNTSDRNIIPLGSPFIYLVKMLQKEIDRFQESHKLQEDSNIFFPAHGSEQEYQNPESQIRIFQESHDARNTTVFLYWADYVNPSVYNKYKKAGFKKILTAGFSGQMESTGLGYSSRSLGVSTNGGRHLFHFNLISALIKNNKIILGGFGSVAFYAAYLEKQIEVLNNYLDTEHYNFDIGKSIKYKDSKFQYTSSYSDAHNFIAKETSSVPNKIDYSSIEFRSLAKIELGERHMAKNSSELQEILSPYTIQGVAPFSSEEVKKSINSFYTDYLSKDD